MSFFVCEYWYYTYFELFFCFHYMDGPTHSCMQIANHVTQITWPEKGVKKSEKVKLFPNLCLHLHAKVDFFSLNTEQNFTEFELDLPYVILHNPSWKCNPL